MVWGGWGDAEKIIRIDVCRVFIIWPREKSGKAQTSFFEFLTLLTRHRFFFFVPEIPNLLFFWKYKKTRTGKWIEIRAFKS